MDSVIERLLAMQDAVRYETMGPAALRAAKRHLIDAIGCACRGYREPAAAIARAIAADAASRRPAAVLGLESGSTPELAAFANGVMIRCLDLNDTYTSAGGVGHPSDYIPAALAMGEAEHAPGTRVLEAIALTYEVFCRLTDATKYGVSGWDHTCNGVIASAMGAGHVMGLGREAMANAIAIAAVSGFALHETRIGTVSMWKGSQSANACRGGVFAARLAGLGMSGPPAAFEGRAGVIRVASPAFDLGLLAINPERLALLECHIKRYPAGFFSQSAIDAARLIVGRLAPDRRIRAVRLGTFPFGVAIMAGDPEKWAPATRESADHSLPYLVARALVYGTVDEGAFTPEALHDPAVRAVLDVLTVDEDPASAAAWPDEACNALTVTLDDGTVEEAVVGHYLGHSRNPLPDADLNAKFLDGAAPLAGDGPARALLDRLWALDDLDDVAGCLAMPVSG